MLYRKIYIGGTLRTTNRKERDYLLEKIEQVSKTAISHGCKVDFNVIPGYPPTINDTKSAKLVKKIYKQYFGDNMVDEKFNPTMGSEDFSYMLQKKPGAYIWIGCGADYEKLHSPYFDFNDRLLPYGTKYWVSLVKSMLK